MSFEERPYILLEVLLAFVLLITCAFPIFSIYVGISKAEYQASLKQHYRHIADDVYANVKQRLYDKQILLADFKSKHYQQQLEVYLLPQGGREPLKVERSYDLYISQQDHERNRILLELKVTLLPQDTVLTYFISTKTIGSME